MMHMTFYWGKTATLLVDPWRTNSWVSYLISLHALFLASVFYQFLENHRVRFNLLRRSKSPSSIESPFLCGGATRHFPDRVAAAVLFGVNSGIGYLLMLAVMSFNGGVFMAVVVGLAVGYFTFRGVEEDVVARENPCECS